MAKTTKSLLAVAVTGILLGLAFVTGAVSVKGAEWAYVALPGGAIFLGLFGIFRMLEKETALYDVEQESLLASTNSSGTDQPACGQSSCCCSEPAHAKVAA